MKKSSQPAKKICRFGLLFGLREGYLLMRNIYGLYTHPFLTTRRIIKTKDLSQSILLFGLPIYLWAGWVLFLLASRIFFFQKLQFGYLAKASFLLVTLTISLFCLFLGYWLYKALRREK